MTQIGPNAENTQHLWNASRDLANYAGTINTLIGRLNKTLDNFERGKIDQRAALIEITKLKLELLTLGECIKETSKFRLKF